MTPRTSGRRARRWRSALAALALAAAAPAAADAPAVVASRTLAAAEIYPHGAPAAAAWRLAPALVVLARSRWSDEQAIAALREAAAILAQCGVRVAAASLYRVDGPARFADFSTPAGRELTRRLALPKPTLYFVRDTRQPVPFEAEAIGRGNSGTRPELAYTVWLTEGVRDPGVALAHELAHVLMDSGEHVADEGNLMREETSPANTALSGEQCRRVAAVGAGLGLLAPEGGGR